MKRLAPGVMAVELMWWYGRTSCNKSQFQSFLLIIFCVWHIVIVSMSDNVQLQYVTVIYKNTSMILVSRTLTVLGRWRRNTLLQHISDDFGGKCLKLTFRHVNPTSKRKVNNIELPVWISLLAHPSRFPSLLKHYTQSACGCTGFPQRHYAQTGNLLSPANCLQEDEGTTKVH